VLGHAVSRTGTSAGEEYVIGVGVSSAATPGEVAAMIDEALTVTAVPRAGVRAVATIDTRAAHPALAAIGWPLMAYRDQELAQVKVPTPNADVERRTGTPSVAEAAALLAAGHGSDLVLTKRTSGRVTVAIARINHPNARTGQVTTSDSTLRADQFVETDRS
jgi:cobalamin biosynthesis protein CbiG